MQLVKHQIPLGCLLCLLVSFTVAQGQPLDSLFEKNDVAEYNGYRITRTFDKSEDAFGRSRTIISRGKKVLARIDGYSYKDATRFALFPLLGDQRNQLIVESYSGGAHCCNTYYIYDLDLRFRVLFDGGDYGEDVGYGMELIDVNHDGVFELTQSVMNFDYFYASHAGSVFPEVVFGFDRRAAKFRPANRAFASYLLRDIRNKESIVSKLNMDASSLARVRNGRGSAMTLSDSGFLEHYYHGIADVLLTYVFAGKRDEGWRYFENNYKLRDKGQLRADLSKVLRDSIIYRSVYRR